jgi:hypothetical protein
MSYLLRDLPSYNTLTNVTEDSSDDTHGSAWKKSNSSSPKYIKQPPLLLYKSTEAKQRIIDKVTECPVDKSISKYLKIQAKDNKRKSENGDSRNDKKHQK